jgi:carboxypeptidase Taq
MIAYRQLETRFRRIGAIEESIAVLHWDAAAIMPAGGARARAEQLATLRVIAHEALTAPGLDDLRVEAETGAARSTHGSANLREIDRRRAHAAALPGSLSRPITRLFRARRCGAMPGHETIRCRTALLERVLGLQREIAAIRATISDDPYELSSTSSSQAGRSTIDQLFDQSQRSCRICSKPC